MSVKQYDSTNKILKLIAGGTLWADCPIGTINAYGGATAPEGWLLCQGQALSRTDYADLFAVIGTNFGAGDGSTTFNAPDFRGEFLRGAGTNSHSGQGSGENVGQHQDGTVVLRSYVNADGTAWGPQNESNVYGDYIVNSTLRGGGNLGQSSAPMSSGSAYAVRPTNTSVNFIIKTKQAPMPADLKAALEAALDNKDMLVWN